jgi:hypothetical protein
MMAATEGLQLAAPLYQHYIGNCQFSEVCFTYTTFREFAAHVFLSSDEETFSNNDNQSSEKKNLPVQWQSLEKLEQNQLPKRLVCKIYTQTVGNAQYNVSIMTINHDPLNLRCY